MLPEESPALLSIVDTTRDPDRLAILVEQLENARVPYVVEAGTALSLLEADPAPELAGPEDWKGQLWVPGNFAARAEQMIAEAAKPGFFKALAQREGAAETEPVARDDAETVDVDEAEPLDPDELKSPVEPR
jgi:hypothetical protein